MHSYTKHLKNERDSDCYGKTRPVSGGGSTSRYPRDVLLFAPDRQLVGSFHPTQKPISLCKYLIKTYTNKHDVVLDSCMGSGTTGIAAVSLYRSFIGIENSGEYYTIAKDRILSTLQSVKTNLAFSRKLNSSRLFTMELPNDC